MNVVLRIDGPSIDAQEIADRIVRDVMTIIIAEGEESMIVDMHLIAGLHVGKAKEVRIAPAIEEEDISGLGHRVEPRSEEHTSELQSLLRISYAVFCLKKKILEQRLNMIHQKPI